MAEYKLLKTEGRAKRAEFHTVHGTIQTPVFMNVGTIGAIKGAVSTMDLQQIGTQVELSGLRHLREIKITINRRNAGFFMSNFIYFYVVRGCIFSLYVI